MAGTSKNGSIDQAIQNAMDAVVARILAKIEKQVNRAVDARISAEVRNNAARGRNRKAGRARARVEITSWTADRRARRVPNFVIEMTNGLDTKKKIVAKFVKTPGSRRVSRCLSTPSRTKPPRAVRMALRRSYLS